MAQLILDENKLVSIIVKYIIAGMEKAVKDLVDIMEKEVLMTVQGGSPGRTAWREMMAENIGIVYKNIASDFIEYQVGYTGATDQASLIKAYIVTKGSGYHAGGPPITAGPFGRTVFTKDMSTKSSNVNEPYALPDGFNQKGNEWIFNSMTQIEQRFLSIISDAWDNIPDSEFQSCVQWK